MTIKILPSNTQNDRFPSNTQNDRSLSNMPNEEFPSNTFDGRFPSNTFDGRFPSNMPDEGFPSNMQNERFPIKLRKIFNFPASIQSDLSIVNGPSDPTGYLQYGNPNCAKFSIFQQVSSRI
jgi:hypothetical protein